MGNCLSSTRTALAKPKRKRAARKGRRRIKLGDLPEDVLRGILSKLPAEEVVRTSVLSSQWRFLWTGCPKLSFHSQWRFLWAGTPRQEAKQNTQMFINRVNAVLRHHSGKGVEGLEVKCLFENKLVDHLDNWIRFAMFSRTKYLALDMAPLFPRMGCNDLYILPSELFDNESASCLRCLQVRFVCIKPNSQFLGFSNLKVLELYMFNAARKDLEDRLCSCCNLEWLSMVKCYLRDELTVVRPLPRLQYLRLVRCDITKSSMLQSSPSLCTLDRAYLLLYIMLQNWRMHMFSSRMHVLSKLLLLYFSMGSRRYNASRWSFALKKERHVQLLVKLLAPDNDKMLCLLSFLRVTPVIEKLDVHFDDFTGFWFRKSESFRHKVPSCEYKHLKSMYVSGFLAGNFQVEFITHVVENAPVIEAVTVDTDRRPVSQLYPKEVTPVERTAALDTIRCPLLERLTPDAKLLLR